MPSLIIVHLVQEHGRNTLCHVKWFSVQVAQLNHTPFSLCPGGGLPWRYSKLSDGFRRRGRMRN